MFASRTDWNLARNRFTQALDAYKSAGRPIYDLTASNPTECDFEFPSQLLEGLASPASLKYEPAAQGLPVARRAVTDYYSLKSLKVAAENIILTTSTSEAYSFIFRLLCEPGDEILIPRPSYPLFEFLANIQDVRLIPYTLIYDHGWHIDLHSLNTAVTTRTRAIIVVNPNNPTGSFLKQTELADLNRICSQHHLGLISDEVFHDYSFDPAPKPSVASNSEVLSFTLSGLSKVAGLPQMKVAWMAVNGPDTLRREALARLDVIADTYLSMNAPIQHALPALLESRHSFQKQLNQRLIENLRILNDSLPLQKSVTRLEVEGGWYAILRVPVTQTDEDLAVALLQKSGVLVHPGHFFDFEQEGYLILSLMTQENIFAEGVKRLFDFFARH
jgi:aspartate/methionine/tyrosine aminotransferase